MRMLKLLMSGHAPMTMAAMTQARQALAQPGWRRAVKRRRNTKQAIVQESNTMVKPSAARRASSCRACRRVLRWEPGAGIGAENAGHD